MNTDLYDDTNRLIIKSKFVTAFYTIIAIYQYSV